MSIYIDEFEKMYSTSGNLQGLRDIILDLAVQGLLAPQQEAEESSKQLYERILNTKQEWIELGKEKKSKNNLKPAREELGFKIPQTWEIIRLDDLAKFIDYRGKTPKKTQEGIPLITAKNIKYGYIDINPMEFISEDDFGTWMTRGIPDWGNVVFTTEAPLANVARLFRNDKFALAQRAITFNTYVSEVDGFLFRALMSPLIREEINGLATGTTVLGIKASRLKQVIIPLPPLEEQKRINDRIEDLFMLIEHLEEKLKRKERLLELLPSVIVDSIGACETGKQLKLQLEFTIQNFETIFQTPESMQDLRNVILQLAIEGKLVPQDPSDEPASVLVESINAERDKLVKEKKIKKSEKPKLISDDEVPFEIPESWEWVRLNEVTDINPRNQLDEDLDVSFIPMKLMEDGYGSKHSCETKKWKSVKKGYTHFAENDIAIAKITPCFENRKSAILNGLESGYGAGTTEFHIVRVYSDSIQREYLLHIFKTQWFINNGINTFSGTAGHQRISSDFLKDYLIPLPPHEEQVRILSRINTLFHIINQMEEKLKRKSEFVELLGTI